MPCVWLVAGTNHAIASEDVKVEDGEKRPAL
jgi:hypothetical protein